MASKIQLIRSTESAVCRRDPPPRKFPSILVEGEEASWTGDEMMMFGTTHFFKNLSFEAVVNNFDRHTINIKNIGSTIIYIRWEKLPTRDSFEGIDMSKRPMTFFFDPCPGVLRPGESKDVMLTFFSRKAGIFREKFQLHTRPVVAGGASIIFSLKGVAVSDSDTDEIIADIEADLAHRQVVRFISNIVSHIINTVTSAEARTRRRPHRLSMEERFTKANPKLYFRRDVVERLHNVYSHAVSYVTKTPLQWDFSIETLESIFHEIKDPKDQVQELNEVKDSLIPKLTRPPLTPFAVGPYHVVYLLWVQTIDAMVEEAVKLQAAGAPTEEDGTGAVPKRRPSKAGKMGKEERYKIATFKDSVKQPKKENIAGRYPFVSDEGITEKELDPVSLSKYRHALYLSTYYLLRNLVEFVDAILDDMWPVKEACYERKL